MDIFVGDTLRIVLKTGTDLDDFDQLFIKFKRPNGTYGKWAAAQCTENDEWMEYETDETDLNLAGIWLFQANAKDPSVDLHGKFAEQLVLDAFPNTTTPPTTIAPTTTATTAP